MEKLEPRLLELLDAERTRARAIGTAAARVDEEPLEVTISHQEYLRASEVDADDATAALQELEREVKSSQEPILSRLEAVGVGAGDVTVSVLANAVTARLTPNQLRDVAELDEVKIIRHERLDHVETMNESVRMIELPEMQEDLGYNGRGVRVAILDSGVDGNHPALSGKVVDQMTTTTEPVTVPGNHGTHVAGTVASNDAVFRGVAYQADLVNIKVLTAGGSGQPLWVIRGLEQAVRRGARVANLSLGWSEPFHNWICNDADCILCQAADNASRLGLCVVVAAGNEDNATANPPFQGKFNIRHPGAARRVVAVGALDKAKQLAAFSSIGPSSGRLSPSSPIRLTKPDVSAPGVGIVSSILGGGFAALSGTSMASPHVAGLAALIIQKNPAAKPMQVKKVLEETCEPVPYAPNQAGYGLINAYGALMRTIT